MKRQVTDQEKIFAEHVSVVGLVFHKNSHNLTQRRQTTDCKKWAKDLSRYFTNKIHRWQISTRKVV